MAKLVFSIGVFGKRGERDNVSGVREVSEPWESENVELISVIVDYEDGRAEQIPAIQNNYRLI